MTETADPNRSSTVGEGAPWQTWAALAVLVCAGAAARLAYLQWAASSPDFAWVDPDLYLAKARRLAIDGHWQWRLDAIEYAHRGRVFHLPPLYSLYLGLCSLSPWPWTAVVGHVVLWSLGTAATYAIATNLHRRQSGLIAAALLVLAPNTLHAAPVFMQEQLYIPLLQMSFAWLTWLLAGRRRVAWWAAGGVLFGLTILTRSMPLYFLPFAAAAIVWLAPDRRVAIRQTAVLLAGVAVVTVTYSVWLSAQVGRWIFVEDHASISMTAYTRIIRSAPPSQLDEATDLARALAVDPGRFVTTFVDFVRSNFKPVASRWVDIYFGQTTGLARGAIYLYAHVMTDVVFALAALLAPFGVILARQRRASAVLAVWPPVVVLLTALAAYGGARYRLPFEIVLLVFLAVVLGGGWRRPSRRSTVAASAVGLIALWLAW